MSGLFRTFQTTVRLRKSYIDSFRAFSKITITDDGCTFVALHPDKKFPYEYSRPMPEEASTHSKSVLKMDDAQEVMRVFKDISPDTAREQLMKMTLTTKHRWYPRARDRKRKSTSMDRQYL